MALDIDTLFQLITSNALPLLATSSAVSFVALAVGAWLVRRAFRNQHELLSELEGRIKVLEGRATSPERTVRRIRELMDDAGASWHRDQQTIERLADASGTTP
jgi:hypothetical protein